MAAVGLSLPSGFQTCPGPTVLFVFCPLQLLKSQSPGSPGVNHSQTRVVREQKAALNHRMEEGAGAAFCGCAAEGRGGGSNWITVPVALARLRGFNHDMSTSLPGKLWTQR